MTNIKTIIAVGDGMADNPVEILANQTPLQAAVHPGLDALASAGELGLVRTIPEGTAPGSDTAFLSILGYDPRRHFSGRAPLEAAGCGVSLHKGELAYRCNLVALEDGDMPFEDKRILSHNGGNVEGEEAVELMETLLQDAAFQTLLQENGMRFYVMPAFRQMAVQKDASREGLCTTPPHDHLGEKAGALLPAGSAVAKGLCRLMERAHKVLNGHAVNEKRRAEGHLAANSLWFWAEGMTPSLENFEKLRRKHGFVVSAVPLVHGIASLVGLDVVRVEGATGELNTNFEGKADAVLEQLKAGYDFALLHVEAPDECTHNGDVQGKVKAIEAFDARCVQRLVDGLHREQVPFRILLLSDHKTLSATRGHDAGPVPYVLYDSRNHAEKTGRRYTEDYAEMGLFVESGPSLLSRLLEE